MINKVNLYDEGINDIKVVINKMAISYKKNTKKNPNDAKLIVIFKRGPIVMKNGEWSKADVKNMTLNPAEAVKYFGRKNLNWGILGYGDPKGGLKELVKFAKTKLNPKQLAGDKQDLKMTIDKYGLFKDDAGEYVGGKIIITVPDKSLGGTDVRSKILETNGYLGINAWKQEAVKLLKNNELDIRIKQIVNNEAKMSDILKPIETSEVQKEEVNDDKTKKEKDATDTLIKLGYGKANIARALKSANYKKDIQDIIKDMLKVLSK